MSVVAVTGITGYLGTHLLARLERMPDIERVVGIDTEEPAGSPKLEFHRVDVRDARLAKILVGVDVVVHLISQPDAQRDEERMRASTLGGVEAVLDAGVAIGVRKLIFLSSAMAYGAHPNNDVPLTESSPLRPNADFAYARHIAEAESVIDAFRSDHRDVIVTVLRPAVVFGPGADSHLSRMLQAPRVMAVRGFEPPLQLAHEEDVADALGFAVERDIAGVYNVACDGWMAYDELVEAAGKKRVELPEAVAFSMAERLWRTGLTLAPPGELHFVMHPWVVDSAALRATGWRPRHTNRETLIEGLDAHRQWLAVGRARVRKDSLAKGAAATLGAIGAMALVRRSRRNG